MLLSLIFFAIIVFNVSIRLHTAQWQSRVTHHLVAIHFDDRRLDLDALLYHIEIFMQASASIPIKSNQV